MTSSGGVRLTDVLSSVVTRGVRSTWPAFLVEDCRARLAVDGVGLALADEAGPMGVAAATPGVGQAGEDLQFALGEGPCKTASETGRAVHSPDLGADDRWVLFGREARSNGIVAASSVPLQVGAVRIGVLDVYQSAPVALSTGQRADLGVFAEAATAVLLLLAHGEAGVTGGRIDELADIRPVVHQAAGMVAVQLDVDLGVALVRLRAHAFATGEPLREVAAAVVARRLTLEAGDPRPPTRGPDPPDPPDPPPDPPSELPPSSPDGLAADTLEPTTGAHDPTEDVSRPRDDDERT